MSLNNNYVPTTPPSIRSEKKTLNSNKLPPPPPPPTSTIKKEENNNINNNINENLSKNENSLTNNTINENHWISSKRVSIVFNESLSSHRQTLTPSYSFHNESSSSNKSPTLSRSIDEELFKNQQKSAKFNSRMLIDNSVIARYRHTSVIYEDFLFMFGGMLTSNLSGAAQQTFSMVDLSCFHFATCSWSNIKNDNQNIVPRCDQSAVVFGDSMFIFGGISSKGSPLDELLEFKFEMQSWSIIQGDGNKPSARSGHSAVVFENVMYIFGGKSADDQPLGDLYEFNFENLKWTKIHTTGTAPSPRYDYSAVVYKESIFIFGGTDGVNKLGDFFEYKIKMKTWTLINVQPSPSPRSGHVAVVYQNSMYCCGGDTGLLEVFEFDFDYRKWFKIMLNGGEITCFKQGFSAVVRGDCIFFFGGIGESSNLEYLCLGDSDYEEELELDEMTKIQSIPKSMWEATVMKKHPEILELRERLRPLSKAISYSRNINSSKTESKSSLSHQIVLQLIMEFLEYEGYGKVIESIEEESSIKYYRHNYPESRLITLLRIGRRRIRNKDVFSNDIRISDYDEGDPEVQVIDHLPGRIEDKDNTEQDINIWDEPNDDSKILTFKENEISEKITFRAATLNKLIQYLTSEKEKVQDLQFMKIFLYIYQSFTSPEMLLKKLIQRYHVPFPKGMPEDKFKTELQQPIRTRVCSVMKYWLDKCSWDFNEKLLSGISSFIDGPLSRDGNLSQVKQLRNSVNKLLKKKNSIDEDKSYVFGVNPPEPKVPRNIFSPCLNLTHIDEIEIARQLTLIEFNIFCQIVPTELLNKAWNDPDQKHKAPHIIEMLKRFDDVVNWVVTTINTSVDNTNKKINTKSRMIEKYIKIAENLKTLKNYQTLFAVLAGLNSPNISKLISGSSDISPRSKEILNELLSNTKPLDKYKELLKFSEPPCIPYLNAFLNEILEIEMKYPDQIGNLINFQKRQFLFKSIVKFQQYQQKPYNLQPVHQIATFLNNFSKITTGKFF
jgi:hypothetical protein